MALSRKELIRLQKGEQKQNQKIPEKNIAAKPENKYLNIVRKDITSLVNVLTGGIRNYFRKRHQHDDFMEHHFPELKR